jgi:hypothetical protein
VVAYTNYLKIVLGNFHDKNFRLLVDHTQDLVKMNLHMKSLLNYRYYNYNNPLLLMVVGLHMVNHQMFVRNRCFSEYTELIHPESVASRDKKYAVELVGTEHPVGPLHTELMVRHKKDSVVRKANRTRVLVAEEHRIPVSVVGRMNHEAVVRNQASEA